MGIHLLWPLGLHFLSFWSFGPSFLFIFVFWAFISFHFGFFISFHFVFLSLHFFFLDTLEYQKCPLSPDAHARISLHGKVVAFSCFLQFVSVFVLMAMALYLKKLTQYMLKRTAVPRIAVIHTRLSLNAALMSGCKAGYRGKLRPHIKLHVGGRM